MEQLRLRVVEYLLKGLLFSTVIVGSYLVIVVLMGLEEVEPSAPWLIGGFLGLLFTCFLYDFALSRIIGLYLYRLRKSLSKWTKIQN